MKGVFFSMLVVFLFISCSSNEYEVEDQLYGQLLEKSDDWGIALAKEMDTLESLYIRDGLMSSASGKAKLDYFDSVAARSQVSLPDGGLKSFNEISEIYLLWGKYVDKDDEAFQQSKFGRLQSAMKDSLSGRGREVSIKKVAKVISNELTAKDLEHPFFRMMSLVILGNVLLKNETAYIREVSFRLSDPNYSGFFEKFALNIDINKNNEILVNDSVREVADIQQLSLQYMRTVDHADHNHIRINRPEQDDYTTYQNIKLAIEQAFISYISEERMSYDTVPFLELPESEQIMLKYLYCPEVVLVRPD